MTKPISIDERAIVPIRMPGIEPTPPHIDTPPMTAAAIASRLLVVTTGDISEFRKSFEGAEPRLKQMLEQIDVAFITGMYYRDPIDR